MNRHALEALEFDRVLEIVAGFATSELGAGRVRSLRPIADLGLVAERLDTVDEMVSWLIRDESWAPPFIPSINEALEALALEGAVWSEAELTGGMRLLAAARAARRSLLPHSSEFRRLGELTEGLIKDELLQKRLTESIDEESEKLKDDASAELKRLRRSIRSARADLIKHLEAVVAGLHERITVPGASVTVRNERFCIPIRREGRSQVGGIVHDESASRATLFVEPPSAIEPMNHLRELRTSERREVERLLRELTDALHLRHPELADTLERLVRLDSLFARAKYALVRGCSRPKLVERSIEGYRIVHGRHPLLLETPDPLVPFDLLLNPGEHTLLVTGPNAGGKTVLLKAIGLISAMTQAGVMPAVGPGSQIPIFDEIFADIGDEQSIDASLSTFTAHLRNITEIIDRADEGALCLIDEIGGATDPVEGTVLARAVLTELTDRRAMTIATSHLGGLKSLPSEYSGVAAAGLGFDIERLQPLYRLTKGRPGRSYALAMAQRVGLPESVLERARQGLSEDEIDTAALLGELEQKEAELDRRIAELDRKEMELLEQTRQHQREAEQLADRTREVERAAHEQARGYLLEARKQIEQALQGDRESARQARSRVEAALRSHAEALGPREQTGQAANGEAAGFEPGDQVWITTLDREGQVVGLRGSDVVVEVRGVKLQLSPSVLQTSTEADSPSQRVAVYTGPELDAQSEIDLRGLIAEDAKLELIRALDGAVQAGLSQLRVIHGKGTGVLRQTVAEQVQRDRRVRSHRLGAPHEGGSGVTVLELE